MSYLVSAAESSHIPPPAPPVTSGPDDKSKSASPAATSKAKGKDAKGAATVAANDDKKSKDAKDEVKEPVKPVIESLYLHVQVSNTEAREFWEKVGFTVTVSMAWLEIRCYHISGADRPRSPRPLIAGYGQRLLPQIGAEGCVAAGTQDWQTECGFVVK